MTEKMVGLLFGEYISDISKCRTSSDLGPYRRRLELRGVVLKQNDVLHGGDVMWCVSVEKRGNV